MLQDGLAKLTFSMESLEVCPLGKSVGSASIRYVRVQQVINRAAPMTIKILKNLKGIAVILFCVYFICLLPSRRVY